MKENKDVQINEKKPKKVIENKQEFEPKLVKEKCILIKDFSVNGEVKKKGTSIYLTKEGKEYLQTQFYIR
jgi:cytoskeletal protein CcmA (bactofilin family)